MNALHLHLGRYGVLDIALRHPHLLDRLVRDTRVGSPLHVGPAMARPARSVRDRSRNERTG